MPKLGFESKIQPSVEKNLPNYRFPLNKDTRVIEAEFYKKLESETGYKILGRGTDRIVFTEGTSEEEVGKFAYTFFYRMNMESKGIDFPSRKEKEVPNIQENLDLARSYSIWLKSLYYSNKIVTNLYPGFFPKVLFAGISLKETDKSINTIFASEIKQKVDMVPNQDTSQLPGVIEARKMVRSIKNDFANQGIRLVLELENQDNLIADSLGNWWYCDDVVIFVGPNFLTGIKSLLAQKVEEEKIKIDKTIMSAAKRLMVLRGFDPVPSS